VKRHSHLARSSWVAMPQAIGVRGIRLPTGATNLWEWLVSRKAAQGLTPRPTSRGTVPRRGVGKEVLSRVRSPGAPVNLNCHKTVTKLSRSYHQRRC
jgi:hypothetical protein